MSDIRRTRREDYLAAIESVCEATESLRASTGAIAEQVGVSKGTVSSVLKELADDQLVDLVPYEGAKLTEQGRRLARRIVRRYRLLELFLSQTLSVDWDVVADDAWRLEPGASEELIERIDAFLKQPAYDPRGEPIPRFDGNDDQFGHGRANHS